jgi:hypothetical protein
VRTALQNGASIDSLMPTTPEEKKRPPMPREHGGGIEGMH